MMKWHILQVIKAPNVTKSETPLTRIAMISLHQSGSGKKAKQNQQKELISSQNEFLNAVLRLSGSVPCDYPIDRRDLHC